jgi:CYTH domain-containing protein
MASEIERKFLVGDLSCIDGSEGVRIAQGYLSQDPERTVRVRLAGDKAWLTIKGRSEGISRAEFEYPIPLADAEAMLALSPLPVLAKTRFEINHDGHLWTDDEFHAPPALRGLVLAEVELDSEAVDPPLPDWLGAEVTDDPRYSNAALAAALSAG